MSSEEELGQVQAELAEARKEAKSWRTALDMLREEIRSWSPTKLITEIQELQAERDALEAATERVRVLARRLLASDLPDAQADGRLILQALDGPK